MLTQGIIGIISFIAGAVISALVVKMKYGEELAVLRTKISSTENLQEIIKRDFVQLANETIKNEQEDLRKQNREALEEKILPLKAELGDFKAKVEKFNISGVENTTKIVEQILNLEKNNRIIADEAKNLTEALTKNQNIKGSYGENLLDTILQSCGMQEGIHYDKQVVMTSLRDDEEHIIRPDVVLNLPDNRHLIIDSKVTLTSYLEYIEDPSKLKDFKTEVKKRIVDLANKNYQEAGNLWQPDFVLMYMPVETSVNLLYEDRDLIANAYKSNVIIVGTASLLATIRLVNQLMAQQRQCESVGQIAKAGTNLYETFVQFCEDLIDVQKRFEDVNKKLNTTINRFRRGNKNKPSLFSQVEALKEYGISTTKEIPEKLLVEIDEGETEAKEGVNEGVKDELDGVFAND